METSPPPGAQVSGNWRAPECPRLRRDLLLKRGAGEASLLHVKAPDSKSICMLYDFEVRLARLMDGSRTLDDLITAGRELSLSLSRQDLEKFVRDLAGYNFIDNAEPVPQDLSHRTPLLEEQTHPSRPTRQKVLGQWTWVKWMAASTAALVVIAGAAALGIWIRKVQTAEPPPAPAPVAVVRASVEGTVARVVIAEGDTVSKGQLLAVMDAGSLAKELDSAEGRLRVLERELNQMREVMPAQLEKTKKHAQRLLADIRGIKRAMAARPTGKKRAALERALRREEGALESVQKRIAALTAALDSSAREQKRLEVEAMRHRRDQVAKRLAQLEIRAPDEGVVLTEHPHQLVDRRVRAGEELFSLGR